MADSQCPTALRVWAAAERRWTHELHLLIHTSQPAHSVAATTATTAITTTTIITTMSTTVRRKTCTIAARWVGWAEAPFCVNPTIVAHFEWLLRLRRPFDASSNRRHPSGVSPNRLWQSLWRPSTTTGRQRWGLVSEWRILSRPWPVLSSPTIPIRWINPHFIVNRPWWLQRHRRNQQPLRQQPITNAQQSCSCLRRRLVGPVRWLLPRIVATRRRRRRLFQSANWAKGVKVEGWSRKESNLNSWQAAATIIWRQAKSNPAGELIFMTLPLSLSLIFTNTTLTPTNLIIHKKKRSTPNLGKRLVIGTSLLPNKVRPLTYTKQGRRWCWRCGLPFRQFNDFLVYNQQVWQWQLQSVFVGWTPDGRAVWWPPKKGLFHQRS